MKKISGVFLSFILLSTMAAASDLATGDNPVREGITRAVKAHQIYDRICIKTFGEICDTAKKNVAQAKEALDSENLTHEQRLNLTNMLAEEEKILECFESATIRLSMIHMFTRINKEGQNKTWADLVLSVVDGNLQIDLTSINDSKWSVGADTNEYFRTLPLHLSQAEKAINTGVFWMIRSESVTTAEAEIFARVQGQKETRLETLTTIQEWLNELKAIYGHS